MNTHFAPGTVTPAQLEEYRQQAEAALLDERRAAELHDAAYRAYRVAVFVRKETQAVYEWAQQGMVRQP